MPSSTAPVTLEFRYCLVGAPWGGASGGMVKPGSGCCDAARELASCPLVRSGVLVRAGAGLAALVVAIGVGAGAGDCPGESMVWLARWFVISRGFL